MICNKCNHKLPDDSEFCQYCGSKIENAVVTETFTPDTEELIEKLNNPDITPDDALSAILKFQAKATIDAMEANAKSQPDNESDEDFGLVPEKPIFTLAPKSVDGEKEYLNKLYTASGEKIKYTRRGSTSAESINGMIDIYDTFLPNGQPYKTIYINMYGAFASCGVPKGFKCVSIPTPTEKIDTKSEENNNHTKTLDGKKSKVIITRVVGGVLSAVLAFLLFLFLTTAFSELRYTIDTKTFDVIFDYSNSNWLILFAFLSLAATILVFYLLAFYRCSKKIRVIFTSVLLVVAIATCLGVSFASVDDINAEIRNDMHKIPKYTSMTLDEFLEDVNRYPDKWRGKEVTLEGRAINCKESAFTLKFPGTHWFYESYETIVVYYKWDESTPRIVMGDYVVVTAKVSVFLADDGTYDAILYSARCEIKSAP